MKESMRTYLVIACMGLLALMSCKDDEYPVVPELNKLTRITCYKNGETTPGFVANVNYTSEGKIMNIQFTGENKLLFIYSGNKFTVMDVNSESKSAEYLLSGDVIFQKQVSKANPYANNEIYVSDQYDYKYSERNLSYVSWTTRWPKEDGKDYEVRDYPNSEVFKWENGNAVLYTQDKREMRYVYGALISPLNFPLRVTSSFRPVDFDAVTPLNLQYGALNHNLPERAYSYYVTNPGSIISEYTYSYSQVGDYITAMTIKERNLLAGEADGTNTYEYSFEYNYTVK